MPPKRAAVCAFLLALFLTAVQYALIVSTPFDLSGDEAHYWEWSKRLDWAYYSKGPLIALLIRLTTSLLGDSELGVRAVALVCELLFSLVFYRLAICFSRPGAALVALLLFRVSLIGIELGIISTTDPPTALFWTLSLLFGYRALSDSRWWIAAFAAVALTCWAKYTAAILIPSMTLFLVIENRRVLVSRHFILGLLAFGIVFFPVVVWNIENGWVNAAHNMSHLGM